MKDIENKVLIGITSLALLLCLVKKRFNHFIILISSSVIVFVLTKNLYTSLMIGLLVSSIYFNTDNSVLENFKNASNTKTKPKTKSKQQPKTSSKKKKKKKKETENFNNKDHIDIGTNFLKAYENLTPQAIEGMSKDTKSLIGTQKKLMSTLNHLGPTLKEGKKVLDTFKNYFDDSDLLK